MLTDFGLTCAMESPEQLHARGTAACVYSAPEQVRGEPATAFSDVFALGVIGYELATGVLPLRGNIHYVLSIASLDQAPPDPRRDNPRMSKGLADVIRRCLMRDQEQRWGADEVCDALGRL